jgi:hypothetical protein
MPNLIIYCNTQTAFSSADSGIQEVANWVQQVAAGQVASRAFAYSRNDDTALGDTAYAGQAAGLFILDDTAENDVSADVCGETIEVDAGASPGAANSILTQSAWCALVRSTAAINRRVTAVNRVANVTLATVLAGDTMSVCGVGFTAVNGAPTVVGTFNMAGNDTADALSLATAINRHPSLVGRVRAVSVAAVVYVGLTEERAATPDETVVSNAATMTVADAAFPVGPVGLVLCTVPGDIGNEVRLDTEAGTGATIATNGGTGLLGSGTGGGTSLVQVVP